MNEQFVAVKVGLFLFLINYAMVMRTIYFNLLGSLLELHAFIQERT